jgi:hypothetical protein
LGGYIWELLTDGAYLICTIYGHATVFVISPLPPQLPQKCY